MTIVKVFVLIVIGLACIVCNRQWSRFIYEKTQSSSYSLIDWLVARDKFERYQITANRFGLVVWGAILIIVGLITASQLP